MALDTLRCIAVLMVLGRHMTPSCPPDYGVLCAPMDAWVRGGWAGVDMFFVLSGFLVSSLLFNEFARTGRISLGRFLLRRGLKIYPAFYFLLFVYGFFEWRFGASFSWYGFVSEGVFLQNYLGKMWNHTWSLAVEEHFYLLVGAAMAWMAARRGSLSGIVPLTCFFGVGCLVGRILTLRAGYETTYASHLRMDSLMIGVFMAYLRFIDEDGLKRFATRWWPGILLASGVLLAPLVLVPYETFYTKSFGFTLNAIGFAGVVLVAYYHEAVFAERRVFRWMAVIGVDSYSIYLWHMFAKRALSYIRKEIVPIPYAVEFVVYMAFALILGVAVARMVEEPILRLRDRLFPSRTGGVGVPVPE